MANPTMASATVLPRPATPVANGTPNQSTTDPAHAGHPVAGHDNRQAPAPPAAVPGKKGKQKKTPEPTEASKLIAQRISQLELDAAGEKDQEAEIGGCTSPNSMLCAGWQGKTGFVAIVGQSEDGAVGYRATSVGVVDGRFDAEFGG